MIVLLEEEKRYKQSRDEIRERELQKHNFTMNTIKASSSEEVVDEYDPDLYLPPYHPFPQTLCELIRRLHTAFTTELLTSHLSSSESEADTQDNQARHTSKLHQNNTDSSADESESIESSTWLFNHLYKRLDDNSSESEEYSSYYSDESYSSAFSDYSDFSSEETDYSSQSPSLQVPPSTPSAQYAPEDISALNNTTGHSHAYHEQSNIHTSVRMHYNNSHRNYFYDSGNGEGDAEASSFVFISGSTNTHSDGKKYNAVPSSPLPPSVLHSPNLPTKVQYNSSSTQTSHFVPSAQIKIPTPSSHPVFSSSQETVSSPSSSSHSQSTATADAHSSDSLDISYSTISTPPPPG